MKIQLVFGNGQITETFKTVEAARKRILEEWPTAQIADEWEETAPGFEGLEVRVGEGPDDFEMDVNNHEIRREME